MKIQEIKKIIEEWAPPGAAWDKDNVGLQIGAENREITGIFLCLELSEKALKEAIKKNCNFIITHHPFIFKPLKKIDTSNPKIKLIETMIKKDITLFSAHTNLDFTKDGVSYELAKVLGLENITFLENEEANQFKLSVYIPEKYADKVADAVFNAGAGEIGEYSKCSFNIAGIGTFEGSEESNPVIGKNESFEKVSEIKFEVLVHEWKINQVVNAMIEAHPYEEPAFDIYKVYNKNVNYGFGAVGELPQTENTEDFLNRTLNNLKCDGLRYTVGKNRKIKKVAVCGGSGADMIGSAIANGADAFVTADIKYHAFQEAEKRILLIDAGHYETEIHAMNAVKRNIETYLRNNNSKIKVYRYSGSTNPVKFYNK